MLINLAIRSIDKPFTYIIPEDLSYITAGFRVVVPFGGRNVEGFIIAVNSQKIKADNLKAIITTVDDIPWFDEHMLLTARWISNYYLSAMAEAMRLFIPGKTSIKSAKVYSIDETAVAVGREELFADKPQEYVKIYEYIKEQGLSQLAAIEREFPDAARLLNYLVSKQLLKVSAAFTRTGARPLVRMVVKIAANIRPFQVSPELKAAFKPVQLQFLQELAKQEFILLSELPKYGVTRAQVKKMQQSGLVVVENRQLTRDSYAHLTKCESERVLSAEQRCALGQITAALEKRRYASFLLHGITGSGKTEVYIEAVAAVRKDGRTAIVLVPEIALTGQIVARFRRRFGKDVTVIHSRLSAGERQDAWQKMREGSAGIVIGARSAIFSPLPKLGLIVIDEEHEFTYKQEETPRYHTREIACIRAGLSAAVVVMGSATPALETYYAASTGKHTLLTMLNRVETACLPTVQLVDMREELKKKKRSVISKPLQELLLETLTKGEQAVILLNRRGYATFVMCRECGYVIKCRHCSTALVYHATDSSIRCHYCGYTQKTPETCPNCRSFYIRFFGTGTQKVEEELAALLSGARIARMDQDTTSRKFASDRIMQDFAAGKQDILLGTQMVAKGHDVPNVTAVGVITADSILNLPDFRAAERVFALLTQASGRAGRGHKPGRVIVQTYNPEHYAIKAGREQDYHAFYTAELNNRQELLYPPFSNIIKFVIQAEKEAAAWQKAEKFACEIRYSGKLGPQELIGPFASAIVKVKDIYRVNLLIKTVKVEAIKAALKDILKNYNDIIVDVDPISVI